MELKAKEVESTEYIEAIVIRCIISLSFLVGMFIFDSKVFQMIACAYAVSMLAYNAYYRNIPQITVTSNKLKFRHGEEVSINDVNLVIKANVLGFTFVRIYNILGGSVFEKTIYGVKNHKAIYQAYLINRNS